MPSTLMFDKRDGRPAGERRPRAWLVEIGNARDPLRTPRIIDLEPHDALFLGRQDGPPSPEPHRVESVDPWMSSDHAKLEAGPEGWTLTDLGSSNGTLVWGEPRSTQPLADGDVFETGSTFWMLRAQVVDGEIPGPDPDPVLGSLHPEIVQVAARVAKLATSRVPLMLLGETGTGKEVLAKALHARSGREGAFVAINTGAVQSNLVASELFGVEKGAHSMADRARSGQLRAAQGGTVLLDEIGDMPLEVQVSLLRVLQEDEVLPVGGERPVPIDVRFVCATHRDIPELVSQGRFRADLFARLKGDALRLLPLRERREDIGQLLGLFLERHGGEELALAPPAYRALLAYDWPLNVRELEKTVQTAVALCEGGRIELDHLPEEIRDFEPERSARPRSEVSEEDRHKELLRLLTAHRGNVSAVARSMGYSRMQVHRWLKQLDVDPSSYRG